MSSVNIQNLMERLRIQSILQRLIKAQGRDTALATVLEAIRLEFPEQVSKAHETTQTRDNKTNTP